MLQERIRSVQEALHVNNSDIARHAGCSPSNISRLKSGARTPSPDSPTISRLAAGIYGCARETGQLGVLEALCALPADEADAKNALIRWLTSEDAGIRHDAQRSYYSFGVKLGELMQLAGMTASRLARLASLDSTAIARFRRGQRVPKCSPRIIERLCTVLLQEIRRRDGIRELADLMQVSPAMLCDDSAVHIVRDWLCGVSAPVGRAALEELLESVTEYSEILLSEQTAPPDWRSVLADTQSCYTGPEGLRRAMMRLLAAALRDRPEELWLYMDGDSDWLSGEYLTQWKRMMCCIVSKGVRLRIIHNIERDMPEMVAGIRRWLPLYMTGLVDPYYSLRYCGERFAHVLMLIPGSAAVTACYVRGTEESSMYHYMTEPESLLRVRESLEELFARSRPLIRVHATDGSHGYVTGQNIRISLGENSVTVSRTEPPHFSCEFLHPML